MDFAILSRRRSITVSLETYPFYQMKSHRTDGMYFFLARNTFQFLSFHVENLG